MLSVSEYVATKFGTKLVRFLHKTHLYMVAHWSFSHLQLLKLSPTFPTFLQSFAVL